MKMRRVLTAFLAVLMLVSLVPAAAFAAGTETSTNIEKDKLYLDKTATLTGDGSYTINMEAFATGQTTSQTIDQRVPMDIVLVLDQSGSMSEKLGKTTKQDALKAAAMNFVKKVYDNGQTHNLEHRIGIATFAGGNGSNEEEDNQYWYLNTGIYDETGKFVGYEDTATSKPTYEKFNGTMDPKGIYFVYVGGKYVQLGYNKGSDQYVPVANPETSRTDLYGQVNGQYQKAVYGEYTENKKTEVTSPVEGQTGYVDANGNPLTWIAQAKDKTKDNGFKSVTKIEWGKHYYIVYGGGFLQPARAYHEIWVQNSVWTDDGGSHYNTYNNGTRDVFTWGLSEYWAFVPTEANTKWILTGADGKAYTGKVYTTSSEVKTGWNVKGVPVTELYERQEGAYKWQYKDGNKVVDYDGRQVYIKATASVFGPALVPVAEGANGTGGMRTNFKTAIDSLQAEGPTRTAKGVELGNKIFEANPIPAGSDRKRAMIVFTDGQPGWSGYESKEAKAAIAQTDITKNTYDATVYTIGLYEESKDTTDQKKFMQSMATTAKDGTNYYYPVTDTAALDNVFQSIQKEISGSTTQVDVSTSSILRDIMSLEGFELTDKSVITVRVVPSAKVTQNTIQWGEPKQVLQLTNPQHGVPAWGTYRKSDNETYMNIVATPYMKNPEAGKVNLHTVDVTGFDYKDQYIAQKHNGSKLVVEITGVKALPTVTTDKNIYTNHEQSGIWAPATSGKRELKAPFPVRPETYMPSKNYVVDYAKPLELDLKQIKMNSAVDVDVKGYEPFTTANTKIDHKYGDVSVAGGKVTYTPTTMNWDGYDTFYVFGTTKNAIVKAASANATGNVWSKVQVIPANNVYYEDTFLTNTSTGTVGITYTGEWNEVEDTTAGKNPGAETSNDNHGWIPVLDGEKGDTDGSSHHADVTGNKTAIAKFTFTGTGVDVYSRTNGKTGTINVKLMDADGKSILRTYVDTLSASGEYYQIPTLSLYEDSKGVALPYGTYTVEIRVSTAAEGRYEYYLDGIRVYNPMNGGHEAYAPNEKNATFMEVRDMLLDANSFSAEENGVSHGFVFIDQLNNGTDGAPGTSGNTKAVGVYKDLGPKNEVYLKKGQMVSFKVNTTAGNQFQIGLKSPTGNPVQAAYTNEMGSPVETFEISHTADMYYSVGAASNGVISIMNSSNELLAITKLKVTNEAATVATAEVFEATDVPTLLSAAQDFADQPVNPDPDVDIENPDVPGGDQKPEKPHIVEVIHKIFEEIRGWFGR